MSSHSDLVNHRYHQGLIGNCAYLALVDQNTNISWMCWPRFDSSFIFGSLIDKDRGGEFSLKPHSAEFTSQQSYLKNTNILRTRIETKEGVYEVTDFAPRFTLFERYHKPLMLFRKVKKISGRPRIVAKCHPRGKYGETVPGIMMGSNHIRYEGLEQPVRLTTNASLTYILEEQPFTLDHDIYFVLSWGIPLEGPLETTFEDFFTRTESYWRKWIEHCHLPQVFQQEVIRSALALKIHQYEDTGAIIASCTTSLPEIPGEGRNWDYRFCWLRDTYYTLSALNSLGHFEEMEKYASFIENIDLESLVSLQPCYRIDGSAELTEEILNLDGYMGNKPVRIGNQAALQIQHDAYGQILMALFKLYTDERVNAKSGIRSHRLVEKTLTYLEKYITTPDNGVWEFRGKQAQHSYAMMFNWAGAAAARSVARKIGNTGLEERAQAAMKQSAELLEQTYSKNKKAYTQALNTEHLDASILQLITIGYFHDKPPALAHDLIAAIEKELMISPGFLVRYRHEDDFGLQRSAFLVCSFWYIEALAATGQEQKAAELLKHVTGTAANHVGLLAEDFDVETNSQWGNFPQTYSHVGVINCAFAIDKANKKPSFLVE
ncbi:glycoside hydrolase family 15 protein [Bdellovibrio sp. SKB1291214]|uniref:glycoside hydrolase family 15 protein n=1 Tax=Bdellovibrio sp. SKB1291214 TaxID=1732569 RepID=UPI000B519692|nr:glycoside hydrolase family 15 protein [Bdellovibrio sp. SKB1291214]UYL07974.1 glycoside hydrolase family 15 protein [Bdellovibrio sp. SKB1291214]